VHHSACEQLASNGFVVFATDHAPDCMTSRPFQDLANSQYYNDAVPPELVNDADHPYRDRIHFIGGMDRRALDVMSLIDFIVSADVPKVSGGNLRALYPKLFSNLKTQSIHLFGHSFGGGTCGTVCCRDVRISSAVLLDSWMYPVPDEDRKRGSQNAKLFFISSEIWSYGKVRLRSNYQLYY
jgi:hypothetical protein